MSKTPKKKTPFSPAPQNIIPSPPQKKRMSKSPQTGKMRCHGYFCSIFKD